MGLMGMEVGLEAKAKSLEGWTRAQEDERGGQGRNDKITVSFQILRFTMSCSLV